VTSQTTIVRNTKLQSRDRVDQRFPKNAPFLPELEAELLTFPQGKTDDQVDSITQALSHETGYNWDSMGS
jgi:hypothetical protein